MVWNMKSSRDFKARGEIGSNEDIVAGENDAVGVGEEDEVV